MRTLVVNALRLIGARTAMGRYIEYMASYWSQMDIPFDRVVLLCPSTASLGQVRLGSKTEIALRSFGGRWPLL